ncbi:hypothetical protein GZL_09071 [Streptomyces sp. 769]|nr:hypothetical protein GZL_09071 [Streptomyces sp. 769]
MASAGLKQPADRSVDRDRIVRGHHGAEPEAALVVGAEQTSTVAGRLDARLLHVVEAVLVALPHIDDGTRHRHPVEVGHGAGDDTGGAGADLVDGVAEFSTGRLGHVEGAQDRALGAVCVAVDGLDQHRHPEYVGEQHELLPAVVTHPADGGEEGDGALPLGHRRPQLLHQRMEVPGDRAHDLAQARIGGVGETRQHGIDRGVLLVVHGVLPFAT